MDSDAGKREDLAGTMTVLETVIDKIGPILAAIASIGTVIISFKNYKKISEVHVQINDRMDQLLKVTDMKSRAEGKLEGQAEGRIERDIKEVLKIPEYPDDGTIR